MSIVNAIPSVWAANILQALDTILVYAQSGVMNRDYEGDIASAGDSVRITTVGDVTISDYTRDSDIASPQALTDAQLTLSITQQKVFNFAVDDIDRRQMLPNLMAEATRRAAYGLAKTRDSFCAGLWTDVAAANLLGAVGGAINGFNATSTKAYDQMVALKTKLDQTDTPQEDRFAVIPPWYEAYLQKDSRFTGFGTVANRAQLEDGLMANPNGFIGRAAGFNVYRSNQVSNTAGAEYKIVAGHPSAWSFAGQLTETVAYRPERRFSDALKGLDVYGAKVVRPSNLALQIATDN